MSKVWGGVLFVTGFLACPCHLVFTLPLVIALLAGTGFGALLAASTGWVYVISGGYFIAALAAGWYLLNHKKSKTAPPRLLPDSGSATQREQPAS